MPRSCELLKQLKTKPEAYIAYLKAFKLSDSVNYVFNGYLHEHRIHKGIDHHKVYLKHKVVESEVCK